MTCLFCFLLGFGKDSRFDFGRNINFAAFESKLVRYSLAVLLTFLRYLVRFKLPASLTFSRSLKVLSCCFYAVI